MNTVHEIDFLVKKLMTATTASSLRRFNI